MLLYGKNTPWELTIERTNYLTNKAPGKMHVMKVNVWYKQNVTYSNEN